MSLIEYSNLLYEVGEKIAWITEGRRLLFICRAFLPDGCENNIQNVLPLLIKLEEENQLGIDKLDVLKDLLERMGKWNLLQIVEQFENKRKEYKRLLDECGRILDECSQLERLISVCKGRIPCDRQEHITDVWTLFAELEKQNNLGIKRLEILKTMAVEMEKSDLLEKLEEFERKRKQEEHTERSQAQIAAVFASAGYAGGRLIGKMEGREGSEDQSSSDFAHARAKETHPQAREEVSQNTDINLPDRIAFVEETYSMTTETTGSGLGSPIGPTELELCKGKDILDNIQQVKKEVENIRKTLDTLGKPEGKTKYGGSVLPKRSRRVMTGKKKADVTLEKDLLRSREFAPPHPSLSRDPNRGDEGSGFTRRLWSYMTGKKKANVTGRISKESISDDELDDRELPDVIDTKQLRRHLKRQSSKEPQSNDFVVEEAEDEEVITIMVQLSSQKIKEGLNVELVFKCKARGNSKLTYQWYKDGKMLQGGNEGTLVLKAVRLLDFGWYKCAASCKDSSSLRLESSPAELDVIPRDGRMYKCLKDIDFDTKHRIGILLTQKGYGFGGWRQVAYKYGMDQLKIKYLEKDPDASEKILEYLHASNPDLTVYDFCKMLKEHNIRRFDIVSELKGHLSVPSSEKV